MPDKFPEAFKRYEGKESLKKRGIKTFEELILSFKIWGADKAPLTRKQTKALAIEAKKRGVKDIKVKETFYNRFYKRISTVFRNPITGSFAPKGESRMERKPSGELLIKEKRGETVIERYKKTTLYRDPITGRFTKKPKEE